MIVFCDGCNTPYHQYCHDPPIGEDVVKVEEKEWFCSDCMGVRRSGEMASNLGEVELQRLVSGEGLSMEEVRFVQQQQQQHSRASITKTLVSKN